MQNIFCHSKLLSKSANWLVTPVAYLQISVARSHIATFPPPPPGLDVTPSQVTPRHSIGLTQQFTGTHLNTYVERDTVHNAIPARVRRNLNPTSSSPAFALLCNQTKTYQSRLQGVPLFKLDQREIYTGT